MKKAITDERWEDFWNTIICPYGKKLCDPQRKEYLEGRKKLGNKPLNEWFPGCAAHHDTDETYVHVRTEVHNRCKGSKGSNTAERQQIHRDKVLRAYITLDNMINRVLPDGWEERIK